MTPATDPPSQAARSRRPVALAGAGALVVLLIGLATYLPGHLATGPSASRTATPNVAKTGCPSSAQTPASGSVTVTLTEHDANSVTPVHTGDTIEFDLVAGYRWNLLQAGSQVQAQPPAGYYDSARNTCVWRFVATSAGTTEIRFTRQPICKPGEACSPIIITYPFGLTIS